MTAVEDQVREICDIIVRHITDYDSASKAMSIIEHYSEIGILDDQESEYYAGVIIGIISEISDDMSRHCDGR